MLITSKGQIQHTSGENETQKTNYVVQIHKQALKMS